ncbi:MAG TPA: hypothetical protein VEI97_07100, partial [bacterium]|nr:hypothetical protein [bacterium]
LPDPRAAALTPMPVLVDRRALVVRDFRPVNGDKISFHWDGTPVIRYSPGRTQDLENAEVVMASIGPAVKLSGSWRERVIVHRHEREDADYFEPEQAGSIHGVGIRSRIYWLYWVYTEYRAWIVDSLERIGLGSLAVEYEQGNKDAKLEALDILKNFSRRSGVAIPVNPESRNNKPPVYMIEAPIQGAGIIMQGMAEIERQIERYIVGQSMSGGADNEDGLGGTGRANFARDTKAQVIQADAERLAETLTGTDKFPGLVNTVCKWTYPEYRGTLRWVFEYGDPQSAEKVQMGTGLVQMGLPVKAEEMYAYAGFSKPAPDDEVVGGMMPQQQPAPGEEDQPLSDEDLAGIDAEAFGDEDEESADMGMLEQALFPQ